MMNPAEFDNIAKVEDSFWWFDGMHRIVMSLMKQVWDGDRPSRILEVGCGTGGFAERLRRQYGGSMDLCDVAAEGLSYARRRGLSRLVQGDARSLPYADAAYDCVLSLDVLVHFPPGAETDALDEFVRVLKPGGFLILRVSALNMLRSRHSEFTLERQRFTRPRLLTAIRHCGLEPVRCTYLNTILLPLAVLKFRVWEPLLGRPPASGLTAVPAWLGRVLRAALYAECTLLTAGWNFPIGQSLLLFARKPASVSMSSGESIVRTTSYRCDADVQLKM